MKTLIAAFIWLAVICVAVYGYIVNIVVLVGQHTVIEGTEFVLRIIGIVIPFLGAIMGLFV